MDVRPAGIEVAAPKRTGIVPAAALLWLLICGGPAWTQQQNASSPPATAASTSDAASPTVPVAAEPNTPAPSALMDTGTSVPAVEITTETLQTRKRQIAESQDLSDELKAKLADIYDKAIAQLTLAGELKAKRKQFSEAVKSAPDKLKSIRETLDQPAPDPTAQIPADLILSQAEQLLTQTTASLEEARRTAENLEAEPKRRADRRTKIPEEISAAKQRLDELKTQLTQAGQTDASALSQGVQTLMELERMVLQARLDMDTDEILSYDATSDLLAAQRDMAARQLAAAEKRAELCRQKLSELRQRAAEEAKAKATEAAKQTRFAHPVIQEATELNARLAKEQAEVTANIDDRSRYAAQINDLLAAIQKDLRETQEQVKKAGGVTDVMGVRLLAKRGKLPSVAESRRRIRDRATKTSEAQVKWIEYDNAWSELSDVKGRAGRLLDQARPALRPEERAALLGDLLEILQTRRETLKSLSNLYLDFSSRLAALDILERDFVRRVGEYKEFIDAHVLWVKSRNTPTTSDAGWIVEALSWLISPTNWHRTGTSLWQDLRHRPLPYLFVLSLGLAILVSHASIHRRIDEIAEQTRQIQTDSLLLTVRALVLTVLLAATWPLLLLLASGLFASAMPDDEFATAIRAGLQKLAYVTFAFGFVVHSFMPRGLAEAHFRVRREPLTFLRRHLRWFIALAVPAFFALDTLQTQQINQEWYTTLGRLVFIGATIGLAVFLFLVLRRNSPLLEGYLTRDGWLSRLRFVWFPVAFLSPVSFACVAAMGYFYGARYLTDRLLDTLVLIFLLLLVRGLFIRWLVIAQRRLALLERRKRQEAERLSRESGAPASGPAETAEPKTQPEVTISQISQQTRRLIDAVAVVLLLLGIWCIWNNVLPALAMIGRYPLLTLNDQEQITLGALATAMLALILTGIVAKNVPGLLEIMILRRLPLDRGVRFAIITISRYVLVIIGVVIAFSEMGIGWSKVQWLVAAMTVGLGFGLQEIFANFISGLIILFEQPIRVDDIVTVGDVTGKVTKIRIRATTIRKADQQELILPNKEFITGTFINWTLSDEVICRTFSVGIAYGSDIRKTERLLREIAASNPQVLKEPAPVVLFKGFGTSSLDFELRVFISGMDSYLSVWHNVNCAIDDAFRKAGIEIAFPQQDVHVRSIEGSLPLVSWSPDKGLVDARLHNTDAAPDQRA